MSEELKLLLNIAAVVMGVSLVLAIVLLYIAIRQVKKIQVPPNAGFVATLQGTPLVVVLGLDLLDLALDIFAAPVAWVLLEHFGLKGLQGMSVIEGLIPGTQLIPTLTVCWFIARLMPDRLTYLIQKAEGSRSQRNFKA